jgi:hypothetical protein
MMRKLYLSSVFVLLHSLFSFGQDNSPLSTFPELSTNGIVYAMTRYNDILYIGGDFSSVGGVARSKIAAIDLITNSVVTTFAPEATNTVRALAVSSDGAKLYVGGDFTSITVGATNYSRNYFAELNTSNGILNSLAPNPNGAVKVIVRDGSTLYIGGDFTTFAGQPRNRVAAIGEDGILFNWNPGVTGSTVNTIALDGSSYAYIGGNFTAVGGAARNHAALLSTAGTATATATLQPWDPNFDNAVNSIALNGNTAYIGGVFGYLGGGLLASSAGTPSSSNTVRSRFAAVDKTSAVVLPFNPAPNGTVDCIFINGSSIYFGGGFTSPRSGMAGVGTGGNTMSWNPAGSTTSVFCMLVHNNTNLYVGGSFATPRKGLALFQNAVLPVTWQTFTAEKSGAASLLKWSTASEQNTKDYEVQHSTNTISWAPLGTVAAAGNSTTTRTYSFIHSAPFKRNIYNYYRILQRDLDGQFSYSKIASLIYDEPGADIIAYPNPTTGSFTVYVAESKEVKLINVVGATVWRKALIAGRNQIDLNTLTKGVYWLVAGDVKKQLVLQ